MTVRFKLLAGVAATSLLATAGLAAPKKHHAKPVADSNRALLDEVRALRAEVGELRAKVNTQGATQATTEAQVQAAQAQAQAAQAQAQQVQAQVAAALAVMQRRVDRMVYTKVAAAVTKEHHNDKFYYKGITITPGGFIEAAGIYRSRFQGDDIASNFTIPFPGQSHPSHVQEYRFSARQSRFSLLAQGAVNDDTLLSFYSELDLQGAAQTSNSNQSNSYVPRLRNFYGTVDWKNDGFGVHLLAGQNWSLLTLQSKGITPRAEVTPPVIDAQYVPGFAWARQPGVRVVVDTLDHHLWFGLSAENAATTFGGTGVPAGYSSVLNGQGLTGEAITCVGNPVTSCTLTPTPSQAVPPGSFQQFYNGAGSSLSFNHIPDFIGKVAYDGLVADHQLHVEGFGIYRSFSVNANGTDRDVESHSFGFGGSVAVTAVPKILDLQVTGIGGRGIGRYGSAGLPDVTFDAEGYAHPISELMILAGATVHASKAFDAYVFAGEEQENRRLFDGGTTGYGLAGNNSGCFIEPVSTGSAGTCSSVTHRIRQITAGVWDKYYQGPYGSLRLGLQYSYTERQLFEGTGFTGRPETHNNMVFLSFRYYPF